MKILPELTIPNAICKFDNYTQSFEWLTLIIWVLALIGLLWILFTIIQWYRWERE